MIVLPEERYQELGINRLNMAHEIIASGPGNDSETESCSERIRQLNSRIAEALDNCKATGLN